MAVRHAARYFEWRGDITKRSNQQTDAYSLHNVPCVQETSPSLLSQAVIHCDAWILLLEQLMPTHSSMLKRYLDDSRRRLKGFTSFMSKLGKLNQAFQHNTEVTGRRCLVLVQCNHSYIHTSLRGLLLCWSLCGLDIDGLCSSLLGVLADLLISAFLRAGQITSTAGI